MKLEEAMRMAAVCGLQTVTEAVRNVDIHAGSLFGYSSLTEELAELYSEYEAWQAEGKPEEIPEWIVKEEDEKLRAYFEEEEGKASAQLVAEFEADFEPCKLGKREDW